MTLKKLAQTNWEKIDIVSFDIFDTLLLRNISTQRQRFYKFGARLAERLLSEQIIAPSWALAQQRLSLHKLAYRAIEAESVSGDLPISRLYRAQATLLGGGEKVEAAQRAAEIEVERESLSPNLKLLRKIELISRMGKRVIAISDIYLPEYMLAELFQGVVGYIPVSKIYSSSDLSATKRSGALFRQVLQIEGAAPEQVLHCGDDLHSDFVMAKRAGLQALHLPRSPLVYAGRTLNRIAHALWTQQLS